MGFIFFYFNNSIIVVGFMKKILFCLFIVTLFSPSNADMHQLYSQEDVLKKFETSHQLFIEQLQKMPVPDNGTFYPVEDVLSKVKLKLQKPAFMNSPSGYLLEPDNKMSNNYPSINSGVIPNDLHTMSEVVLLPLFPTPKELGYSYYNPRGTDPSYVIHAPGIYRLGSGFSTHNESAIVISSPNVILDGNGHKITGSIDGIGVNIERSTLNVTVKNFFGINNFDLGIKDISFGSKILNNSIGLNFWSDIYSGANFSQIQYNTFNGTPYNFYGSPRNAVISDNNLEDISLSPGELYLIGCDNVTVTRNHLSSISSFGGQDILVRNNSFSSDSDIVSILMTDEIRVIENSFYNFVWLMANQVFISANSFSGSGSHDQDVGLIIYGNDNEIRKNKINNCAVGIIGIGARGSIIDNTIEDTGIGMSLTSNSEGIPGYTSWTVSMNKIIILGDIINCA